ncbi:hypothetical protein K503DRAFT_806256 [Rhizopogon vinicolor AM-OR11-026]|uniref:Uncharacterized protein n=1 Tax=Rhizopogon vinicolor AM-OR11-026 TaxID=1314800 RepID=A0A1B7MF48_9AGAM|nr:hypothetical protein K503DRAFT_806256 [Rhizopogon vinicolor AM-OR11-026]
MPLTTPQMPFHQELSAPSFDPAQPRSLLRYFGDLERWTLRYVPIEVADLWECLPGWISATDWPALKSSVAARHPACHDEHRYSFADFVTLVDGQASQGIHSINQWSKFLNQFLIVSQYLLARHHLDPLEQQCYLL